MEILEGQVNKVVVDTAIGSGQIQPTNCNSFMVFKGLCDCSEKLVILLCTSWNVLHKGFLSVCV